MPLFSGPDYDLVVDFGHGLKRVQVKTSVNSRDGRLAIALATRGGNRGRTGIKLGGPKYSGYEIRGADRPLALDSVCLESAIGRGGAGVGEPGRTVNSVLHAERVRLPPPPSDSAGSRPSAGVRQARRGRTRISPGHQLTIPVGPFRSADLSAGDRFDVIAEGPGRIRLCRIAAGQSGRENGT